MIKLGCILPWLHNKMADNKKEDDDEQHRQAFGEHTRITPECKQLINLIKNNNQPGVVDYDLSITPLDATRFTELAWTLLGRYIANNTHLNLIDLNLDHCYLTDEKMISLFGELVRSRSLTSLHLISNDFGLEGVQKMVPLLLNAVNLSKLFMCNNANINSECFEILISALDGKSIEVLDFSGCNIEYISALSSYNLPHLRILEMNQTNIGIEGFITISNLLQKEDTTLTRLELRDTVIDDEGAEILAASLKHNNKLKVLYLGNNNDISERGYRALLKVLVDVSSIESMYTSNHTLERCYIGDNTKSLSLINSACKVNQKCSTLEASGRAKVIKYHLNSQTLKDLCYFQGVEYTRGSIFADIESTLLPKVFSLIGNVHGQSELYTALTHTAPNLLSYIDRKALIEDTLAKVEARGAAKVAEYERKIAALKTEMLTQKADLSRRLALIDLGEIKQSAVGEDKGVVDSSKKRQIS